MRRGKKSATMPRRRARGPPSGTSMLYQLHEFNRNLFNPLLAWSQTSAKMLSTPESWLSQLPFAQRAAANCELVYRLGKDYEKPIFGIQTVNAHGQDVAILERVALAKRSEEHTSELQSPLNLV